MAEIVETKEIEINGSTYIEKTFSNGAVVREMKSIQNYIPKEVEQEPTEEELITAELLLNQADIMAKQAEQDEVLAEILLNQMEV